MAAHARLKNEFTVAEKYHNDRELIMSCLKWAASWQNQQNDVRLISVFAVRMKKAGSLATHWVHSEASDQTGQMPRLVWVFVGHTVILLVLSWVGSNDFFFHFSGSTRRHSQWNLCKDKRSDSWPIRTQDLGPCEREVVIAAYSAAGSQTCILIV